MFKTLGKDRPFIENKFHNVNEPFDPYQRMAYHGWTCPNETGKSVEEIKKGLKDLARIYENESHTIHKARAIEYVLDNTQIDLNEHDYFFTLYTWNREIAETTVRKWEQEVFRDKIPEVQTLRQLFADTGASTIWPDFDHVVPDWASLLSLGFKGILDRSEKNRADFFVRKELTEEKKIFFDGIQIEYTAILRFLRRVADLAKTKTHEKAKIVASSLDRLSVGAPQNFFDALQLIYTYFMISESVDYYQVRSLGNGLDFSLFPFYQADLRNGTFTRDEMKEFLGYFFMQWSAIGNYWGQPFYLGGSNSDGSSRINDLSYDIIDVYSTLGIYNPKIQIKYSENLPVDFLNFILSQVRRSVGSYVFVCEKNMITAVMNYGATYEEAYDFDIRGCYETGVRANEVSTGGGYINALKAVELTFHNGFDMRTGQQVTIQTGEISEFTTFKDFYAAFLKQWSYLIDQSIYIVNEQEKHFEYINPSSLYSGTIEHALKLGRDGYAGGVKFNNCAHLNCGFASMVDSLMAVKELVFDKNEVSLEELKNALEHNWEGYEKLRLKAQNLPHKYGNDDEVTDRYAEALSKFFAMKTQLASNSRGGVNKATMHTAMMFIWEAAKTLATPDGRKAGEEMSKNGSPSVGMDREGATALVLSSLKLHPANYLESFCVDLMLHPSAVSGDDGLKAMKSLLDAYNQGGGMSLQFNIFNADTLKDAQAHPEKYQNLQVRVCGWNVLWNNLSKKEQDSYILRAQNLKE